MLSAYFLRKIHSIMTNCKFVIGNEVKHLVIIHSAYPRSFTFVQDDNGKSACFYSKKLIRVNLRFNASLIFR